MSRKPVAMSENERGHFVVCDDGSVWERRQVVNDYGRVLTGKHRWVEIEPIPGTAAATPETERES